MTTTTTTATEKMIQGSKSTHEAAARLRRASALASAMQRHGLTVEQANLLDDAGWRTVGLAAGLNSRNPVPSPATRALALAMLAELPVPAPVCVYCGMGPSQYSGPVVDRYHARCWDYREETNRAIEAERARELAREAEAKAEADRHRAELAAQGLELDARGDITGSDAAMAAWVATQRAYADSPVGQAYGATVTTYRGADGRLHGYTAQRNSCD